MMSRLSCNAILVYLVTVVFYASTGRAEDELSSSISPVECTMSAQEVVEQFIELFYLEKEVRLAFESWVHSDYIQHKPTLPDGREAVITFLEKLLDRFPDRIFTIHRVIASEDLVAVHYHSQANSEEHGFAVVDIFRVDNCRMVEHWDVVQPVPAHSENENTMF